MENLKFKKSQWCFCEFVLQQVMETEQNRITSVSDGMFRLGSHDLSDRCFPLEMKVKSISDNVNYWSEKFHKTENNSLNHPELNRELITRWVEMCENRENEKLLIELSDNLSDFAKSVLSKTNDLKHRSVEGVNLFR